MTTVDGTPFSNCVDISSGRAKANNLGRKPGTTGDYCLESGFGLDKTSLKDLSQLSVYSV